MVVGEDTVTDWRGSDWCRWRVRWSGMAESRKHSPWSNRSPFPIWLALTLRPFAMGPVDRGMDPPMTGDDGRSYEVQSSAASVMPFLQTQAHGTCQCD